MNSRFSALAFVSLALVIALVAVAPAAAQSPSPASPRLVTVSGEAQINVVPDEVVLTLGVETSNKQLQTAKSLNDDKVKQVIAAAEALGVPAKHIQTDHIGIEPRYRENYEQRDFVGYFVRQTVVVTLKDISRFEDLLTAVLESGANYVHGIQFRTTELRKYRDEARSLAIKAAQEKATAMAAELGQSIGKPSAVREEQNAWWSGYNSGWGSSAGSNMMQNVIQDSGQMPVETEGALAPGQISVTARVSVSFEME